MQTTAGEPELLTGIRGRSAEVLAAGEVALQRCRLLSVSTRQLISAGGTGLPSRFEVLLMFRTQDRGHLFVRQRAACALGRTEPEQRTGHVLRAMPA